jgi:uncharacterized protein
MRARGKEARICRGGEDGERAPSAAVRYFKARTPIPNWYQVHLGEHDVTIDGVRVLPFATFCKQLALP